jgi:hypothetical protein
MAWSSASKCMWSDKFHAPTVTQLREGYQKPLIPVFDAARDFLLGLHGVSESVAWHGVPWRWTLVYRCASEDRAPVTRAFAYLIPDPNRLQVCVPLGREQVAALPMRRFKKNMRDSIVHARSVAGVSWPSWDAVTRPALDEVIDLLHRKHRMIVEPNESVTMSA